MLKVRWLAVSLLAFAICTADLPGAVAQEGPTVSELLSKAKTGDAIAEYTLGNMYSAGKGVSRDYAEAVKWYRKAAEQGYVRAQESLGFMYEKGQGIPRDYAEAIKWFRKAAEQGDAVALWPHLLSWARRPAGLCRGGQMVSQGGRAGGRHGPIQSRPHV